MNTETMFSSKSNEWETPHDLYNKLDNVFNFTLDPSSTKDNHKAPNFYTMEDDGLNKKWGGILFSVIHHMAESLENGSRNVRTKEKTQQ